MSATPRTTSTTANASTVTVRGSTARVTTAATRSISQANPKEATKNNETDPRIAAIRAAEKIGRGSCSLIDECYGDNDLLATFEDFEIKTPKQALQWAYSTHQLWLEQALNQRWGEDTDPELATWKEWKEWKKANLNRDYSPKEAQ